MEEKSANNYFPTVGDGSGLAQSDALYKEELQLALRNRGMPLEALRYPITPTGLHYLLIHYDIPAVDADGWRLKIAGQVATPLELTLEEIKKRPRQTIPVTMECAGNGRALFAPRRISQPWLLEAIGTAEWTGTPLRTLLQEAGVDGAAAEIVFTGLDRGFEGDQVQHYQRSLTVEEATKTEVLLVYEMNGEPLPPQHGFPLRLVKPGWYGMASVKWLNRIEAVAEPFQGYQMVRAYRYAQSADGPGRGGRRDQSARPDDSSRHSGLHDPRPARRRRCRDAHRQSVGREWRRGACRSQRRRRRDLVRSPTRRIGITLCLEIMDIRMACHAGRSPAPGARQRCHRQRAAGRAAVEFRRLWQQRRAARKCRRALKSFHRCLRKKPRGKFCNEINHLRLTHLSESNIARQPRCSCLPERDCLRL